MMDDWRPISRDCYDPLKAGSVDGTDTEPHDQAVWRAMNTHYTPPDVDTKADRTLFVGRLPHSTEEEQLHHKFSAFGVVEKICLIRDIVTGFSKGYCFVEYRRKRDADLALKEASNLLINGCRVLVDREAGHQVKGWVPRRLGGGWGGRKEAGQLRFGCQDRPWKKPIVINPPRPSGIEYNKDSGKGRQQGSQGSVERYRREESRNQEPEDRYRRAETRNQGSDDRYRRDESRNQGAMERFKREEGRNHKNQRSEDRYRGGERRHQESHGSDSRYRNEDNRQQERRVSTEERHRRDSQKHREDMRRQEERREWHKDRAADKKRRRSRSPN